MKRLLSIVMACGVAVVGAVGAYAWVGGENDEGMMYENRLTSPESVGASWIPDNYPLVTANYADGDGNVYGAFDLVGFYMGVPKQTTYAYSGYHTFLAIEGDATETDPIRVMGVGQAGGFDYGGLNVEISHSLSDSKVHAFTTYEVKNTSGAAITFSMATYSDIKIGGNDSAPVKRDENDKSFYMYECDDITGPTCASGEDAQFSFYGDGRAGTTPVDGLYVEVFYDALDNIFADNSVQFAGLADRTMMGVDTGMSYSWLDRTVLPGETLVFRSAIAVTAVSAAPMIVVQDTNIESEDGGFVVRGEISDVDLGDEVVIYYGVNGGAVQSLAGVVVDGTAEFEIEGLLGAGSHEVEIYGLDSFGNYSNTVVVTVEVAEDKVPEGGGIGLPNAGVGR